MMDHWLDASFFEAVLCPAVILALSIPHIRHVFKQLSITDRQGYSLVSGYEDEDGIATDQSEKGTSDITQRVILSITAVVAVLTALLSSLNATDRYGSPREIEPWLQFFAWVRYTLPCPYLFIDTSRSCCWFKNVLSSPGLFPRRGTT